MFKLTMSQIQKMNFNGVSIRTYKKETRNKAASF